MNQELVATVVLNYRCSADVCRLVPQLLDQVGVRQLLVIVDNDSRDDSLHTIKGFLEKLGVPFVSGREDEVGRQLPTSIVVVESPTNGGYSAGNNIGLRIAQQANADFSLVINPDVVVEDRLFLRKMVAAANRFPNAAVIGPAIRNERAENESPMPEPPIGLELLFPYLPRRYGTFLRSYADAAASAPDATAVDKVHGSCFLIRNSLLLSKVGFLDERVFLYCEEAILGHRVRASGHDVLFYPLAHVTHARGTKSRGNLREFLKSRRFYNIHYRQIPLWARPLLRMNHALMLLKETLKGRSA